MALENYRRKRQFGVTSEPRGRRRRRGGNRYVIQRHAARQLHYDLRLELDGVMKSWAVTRGPSVDPAEKRLAVEVEDHPVGYNEFEGTISQGEYGGGTVMIWDRGRWVPRGDARNGYANAHLDFDLEGDKLHGRWHLVRKRGRPGDRRTNWILIKGGDERSRAAGGTDVLRKEPLSVATGRSMEEIAAGKGKERVWHSNRSAGGAADFAPQSQRTFKEELRAATAQAGATTNARPRTEAKPPARPLAMSKAKRRSPTVRTTLKHSARGADWLHEIKFDGYRIEARLDRGKVQLLTRNHQDWTLRFPPIVQAVIRLSAQTALLDGELVVEDQKGAISS